MKVMAPSDLIQASMSNKSMLQSFTRSYKKNIIDIMKWKKVQKTLKRKKRMNSLSKNKIEVL